MLRSHHFLLAYFIFLLVVIGLIAHAIQRPAPTSVFAISYLAIAFLLYLAILPKFLGGWFHLTPLFVPILLYFGWTLITAVINGVGLTVYLISVKDYVKYVLLYFAIVNLGLDEDQIWYLLKAFLVILLLQIPTIIFQFLFILSHPDRNCGTFGHSGTGQLMIWIVIAIMGLIGYTSSGMGRRGWIFTAIGLFFVVPFLGSARAILYFLPLTFIFVALHHRLKQMLKYVVLLGVLFVLAIGFSIRAIGIGADEFKTLLFAGSHLQGLAAEDITEGKGYIPGRFFDLIQTVQVISSSPKLALAGRGFGSIKLANRTAMGVSGMQAVGTQSQLGNALIETGVVGLFLYLMIVLRVYRSIRLMIRSRDDPRSVAFGYLALATVFTSVLGITYHGVWYTVYSSLPFWLVAAFTFILNRETRPELLSREPPVT